METIRQRLYVRHKKLYRFVRNVTSDPSGTLPMIRADRYP